MKDSPSRSPRVRREAGVQEAPATGGEEDFGFPSSEALCWTLENGLELIVVEDSTAPLASLQGWCRVGSIDERQWLGGGMSHLAEHMLFKGTDRREGGEIARSVQDVGGYFNAYTSFERTVYWIDTPSEGVSTGLDVLCDILTAATLPEEEFATEQDVIRREIAMGNDDPSRSLSRLLFSSAFAVHPYRHPVIGYLDVFNRITRDDLADFYRAHYVPNNMFLVVVGDVDAREIHRQVSDFFSGIARGRFDAGAIAPEPRQLGRREVRREFPTQLSHTSLTWHIPGVTHRDLPALDVLATILGAGKSSRLHATLREKEALVHSVNAYAYTPAHEGIFSVGAVVDPGGREKAEGRMFELLDELIDEGVREDEVGKARRMALSDQLHALTTTQGRAADLGSNWLLARNLDFTGHYLEELSRVTPQAVQAVAARYLVEENLTVASLDPEGSRATAPARKGSSGGAPLVESSLSNGLTLLVREDSRLPLAHVHACFSGGLLAENPSLAGSMRLFAKTLIKGTSKSNAEAIALRLESAGGSISSGAGRNTFSVTADVLKGDLEMAFDTIAEIFCDPVFPEDEIEREREVQLASIKVSQDQPFAVASRLMRERIFGSHPYGRDVLGTEDSVARIDRGCIKKLGSDYLAASNGVIAVFGDVRADNVERALEEKIGSLAKGREAFADRKGVAARGNIAVTERASEILEREQAIVMVGFAGCNLYHQDRLALEILDEACSDLSSRLFQRVREELGLAYSVGSSFGYGFDPGSFVMYASTSPESSSATSMGRTCTPSLNVAISSAVTSPPPSLVLM
ncbi:MAG: M16 family metallopeptidase [Verrucomicrobiales bacterium]